MSRDREVTFANIRRIIQEIQQDATGYNRYPAPGTRVYNFQSSTAYNMLTAVAEATDLQHEMNRPEFPNLPEYDIELLDGDSGLFENLRRAIQRAPRYIEPTPIVVDQQDVFEEVS